MTKDVSETPQPLDDAALDDAVGAGKSTGGVNVLMADGSVKFVAADRTPNGGTIQSVASTSATPGG